MPIRNTRLKLGKNYEKFKKHKQAEFQVITLKSCFYKKIFDQTIKKYKQHPLHASQDLNILLLAPQLPNPARFDKILRSIPAEAREFAFYKHKCCLQETNKSPNHFLNSI